MSSEEKVNSSSPLSTLSKALDAVQLAPNVAVVDSVQFPTGDNSPTAAVAVAVADAVLNGAFDAEAPLDVVDSVQFPTGDNSPTAAVAASVADAVLNGAFDTEASPEGPGNPSPLQVFNDDAYSPMPLAVSSDGCPSVNSSRVSANPPPKPVSAINFGSLFFDEAPSKDEVLELAIVPSKIGAGLANLGNTCFLNSIMQCFTHTVPFVKDLLSCSHSLARDGHYGFCVICAFREHMGRAVMSPGQVLSPLILVDNLSFFSSDFRRHQQEDAHEFMQCALDKLERCFLDLKKNSIYFKDDNIVEKVFGGRLVSKLRCCNCGHSSDTYEPLIDLSLEIENVDTLSSALDSFTMVEDIDAKLNCDGCKEEVSKKKQLMLDQTPSIATFHLKRFKTDGMFVEKIDKKIEFPLELDLQPYTISKGNDDDDDNVDVSLKYDLYAVIVHMGSSSTSGHYYCFVRTAPDTWHDMDDYKVTKVSEETVLSQEAYILFYARQGTPWFSDVADSLVSCMYPSTMNTSPKSVLDIVDGLNKPNPTFSTNAERNEAGGFGVFPEQEVVFSCQEKPELPKITDVSDASHGCGQFPAGSYRETANLSVSKDINAQVPCENNAISTGTALFEGNQNIEHGTSDTNKCRKEVVDSSENLESNVFHSLTPPSSPDNCFKISRDHLNMESEGSSKKSNKSSGSSEGSSKKSNKSSGSSGDPHKQEAIRYLKKHGARRSALLEYVGRTPENKRKQMDSLLSKKDSPLSVRKKPNHASIGCAVTAGTSK